MTSETEVTPRERIEAVARDLGLTVEAEFVPYSRSRNAKQGAKVTEMSLNWRVTLTRTWINEGKPELGGVKRPVLTTNYSAGIRHCPSYDNTKAWGCGYSLAKTSALTFECEQGKAALGNAETFIRPGAPILPDACDVLYSLALDSDVLDSGSFEEWASNYGYDADSRKAEATYRACLEIALKLRNGIGEDGLARLREACQDY